MPHPLQQEGQQTAPRATVVATTGDDQDPRIGLQLGGQQRHQRPHRDTPSEAVSNLSRATHEPASDQELADYKELARNDYVSVLNSEASSSIPVLAAANAPPPPMPPARSMDAVGPHGLPFGYVADQAEKPTATTQRAGNLRPAGQVQPLDAVGEHCLPLGYVPDQAEKPTATNQGAGHLAGPPAFPQPPPSGPSWGAPPPPPPAAVRHNDSSNESPFFRKHMKRILIGGVVLVAIVTSAAVGAAVASSSSGSDGIETPPTVPPSTQKNAMPDTVVLKRAVDLILRGSGAESVESQYGSMEDWDVSQITDFSQLFDATNRNPSAATFDADISRWNTSSSTSMAAMFRGCTNFNQGERPVVRDVL